MIENGIPSSEILEAIRSGSEGDQPLEIQGEEETAARPSAKSRSEERPPECLRSAPPKWTIEKKAEKPVKAPAGSEGSSSAASTPHLSSDRSSRDTPTWVLGSGQSPLGFTKKASSHAPPPPKPEVKEECEEEPGPSVVEPEADPGRITRGLEEIGIFGEFSKKADRPSVSEAAPSRVAPYVPLGLPRRSRPLEEAKLEEFRKLATHLFEELVIHEVEMDLVETVSSKEGVIDYALFHRYTDPKSAGTALRYARLLGRYLQAYEIKYGAPSVTGPKIMGLEAIQAFIISLIEEEVGFYTPRSFLYAVEYFGGLFGYHSPGCAHPRVRRLCTDYVSKSPERRPAPFFEIRFLDWLEKVVLDENRDLQTRIACGKLRLCTQSSIRHSDLAGTAMRDVEWCRMVGGTGVLGLRAKAAYTKSGPRTWAASLLRVHPDNDKWLIRWVELLLVMHGHDWRTHSFVGRAAGKTEGWEMYPPLISEDTLTVKHALLADIDAGNQEIMPREQALHLRWHSCKTTMPTYMTHFKVTTRTVRFQGAWKDPAELMPDLYLRESQILVLKAQIEVLDQIRRGATIQTLEGRELDSMRQPDWATVETLAEENRLPKSSGAERGADAMRRAIVCTEDGQGERRISGDCAVPVINLPPALRGAGAEDMGELELTLEKEKELSAKCHEDYPIEQVETTPNGVEMGPDSDDSEEDPATTDLEMHHTFVQLAAGAGRIHKPSHRDEGLPRCGSQGSRFAELQLDHSWGANYKLSNKCFGRNVESSSCPLLCDFVLKKNGRIILRCGRRCRGDQVEGHLNPSESGFDSDSRHRCTLHSEEVLDHDI